MSTNVLKMIPTVPNYIPTTIERQQARDLIVSRFPDVEVNLKIADEVLFVDPGANLKRVICPICGSEIEIGWWQQAMDAAYQMKFTDLSIHAPCCGAVSSLNDLQYDWPAGFAQFVIEIQNLKKDWDPAVVLSLERILGSSLREIWAYY
jgi:hypothetical protein